MNKEISEKYDKLRSLWQEAENQLKGFPSYDIISVPIKSIPDKENEARFSWEKVKGAGGRRICYNSVPVLECTTAIRIGCVMYFPILKRRVLAAAQECEMLIDSAIEELEKYVTVE